MYKRQNLTRLAVATACGCSEALISYHFGSMKAFRRTVMRHAVIEQNLSIIAQGVIVNNPYVQDISDALKQRALMSCVNS